MKNKNKNEEVKFNESTTHNDDSADTANDRTIINNRNLMITDDDSDASVELKENGVNGHAHSLLVENSLPTKNVTFNLVDRESIEQPEVVDPSSELTFHSVKIQKENEDINENKSSEEEDEFCDSFDPAHFPENGDSYVTESPLLTTDSGIPFNEIMPGVNGSSVKKRTNNVDSSTDSQEIILKSLEKPYPNRKHHDHKKFRSKYRQHGIKSHKRLDENHRRHEQGNHQSNSNGNQRAHHSTHLSRSTNATQSNRSAHQPNSGNEPSDGSDTYESSDSRSSMSNDTIGIKIVNSLERMEDNMESILHRLDSIEETIKEVSKPSTPWWKQFLPSKTVLIWTLWPVIVNVLFLLYRRRVIKKKIIKKC